ncbi:uncharacterized protein LOC127750798 [Frankliniella occidentalis]|uniref:Uncharacterized protein LOC127750798 n=1 Tax=Frankliniella occidentalis TaxID=133901 RepID=A0A9C6XSA7_FRAOC|nr:uncharacterized protein LOC127750798 [Frankliniella occidentalis]
MSDPENEVTDKIKSAIGTDLWTLLEKPPYNFKVTESLANVLESYGFNKLCSFRNMNEIVLGNIEKFMVHKLPRILERKYDQEKAKNPLMTKTDMMEKYYGSLFAYCPEEFELGGLKSELVQISAIAENIYSEKKCASIFQKNKQKAIMSSSTRSSSLGSPKSFVSGNQSGQTERKDNTSENASLQPAETLVEFRDDIARNVSRWLKSNAPDILDDDADDFDTNPDFNITVAKGDGGMSGEIECPVKSCRKKYTLQHTGGRWSNGNLYRHINSEHILKPIKQKQQQASYKKLTDIFQKVGAVSVAEAIESNCSLPPSSLTHTALVHDSTHDSDPEAKSTTGLDDGEQSPKAGLLNRRSRPGRFPSDLNEIRMCPDTVKDFHSERRTPPAALLCQGSNKETGHPTAEHVGPKESSEKLVSHVTQ